MKQKKFKWAKEASYYWKSDSVQVGFNYQQRFLQASIQKNPAHYTVMISLIYKWVSNQHFGHIILHFVHKDKKNKKPLFHQAKDWANFILNNPIDSITEFHTNIEKN
jgi:hypothetical protein